MTSVGGDAFWLIYDARSARRGALPERGGPRRRERRHRLVSGARARGDPAQGHPAGDASPCRAPWTAGAGRMPTTAACRSARDLAAAIEYARDGFPVTRAAGALDGHGRRRPGRQSPRRRALYLPDGRPPRPGQRLRNPDLARTLERIAASGRAGFYEGETAAEMARYCPEPRRVLRRARLRRAARGVGRAAARDLSRRHHLRDAAADPGPVRAPDARPRRAVGARPARVPRDPITCTCSCRPR